MPSPEQNQSFISEVVEPAGVPRKYELAELEQDIDVFSDGVQKIVRKMAAGKAVSQKDRNALDEEKELWWEAKYGFPYSQTAARETALVENHGSQAEKEQFHNIQQRLLKALDRGDTDETNQLRQEYKEKYPDQMEGVTILFELKPFMELERRVEEKMARHEQVDSGDFKEMTQMQFLLTHFALQNSKDREFMQLFWDVGGRIARSVGREKNWENLCRGILTQVATYKIFDSLDLKPKLSHPREDAFEKIDMWSEDDAIQIKTSGQNQPMVVEAEAIGFPAVQTDSQDQINLFNSRYSGEARQFRAKIKEYQKRLHKKVKGYFIVIPESSYDPVTGEPNEFIIKYVRNHLPQVQTGQREIKKAA